MSVKFSAPLLFIVKSIKPPKDSISINTSTEINPPLSFSVLLKFSQLTKEKISDSLKLLSIELTYSIKSFTEILTLKLLSFLISLFTFMKSSTFKALTENSPLSLIWVTLKTHFTSNNSPLQCTFYKTKLESYQTLKSHFKTTSMQQSITGWLMDLQEVAKLQ